jgi:hypothetical protein
MVAVSDRLLEGRRLIMKATQVVATCGSIVLTAIGLTIWMEPSIMLASVYWLLAVSLAVVFGLLSVQVAFAGAPLSFALAMLALGAAPVVVSVTPSWELYPLAGAMAIWAAQEGVTQGLAHRAAAYPRAATNVAHGGEAGTPR